MTAKTRKLTNRDKIVIAAIKRCGFLALDLSGQPALETSFAVTPWRMSRLVDLGYLEPSGDALIKGMPSQTWMLTEKAGDVA